MTKRVLITGLTGMVGSHFADYLLVQTDWMIFGMVRWRSPLDNINHLLDQVNAENRIGLVYADLRDPIAVRQVVKKTQPDFVFHLAAQSYPRTSFDSPLDTYDTNVQGTVNLLEALKELAPDARIHICSSSEVFGRVSKDKLPINEECGFHPASPYAISKVGTDLIGRYYAEAYGLRVAITRMFTHTGPRRGDVFAESSFAKQIALIESGVVPPIIKVGNLDSLRTVADVRDAVRAYYLLLTSDFPSGEAYNIGGSKVLKVSEILEHLIGISSYGKHITVEVDPDRLRPIDADLQIPDTKKFTELSSWTPEIEFEKTMSDLLDFWREKIRDRASGATLVR